MNKSIGIGIVVVLVLIIFAWPDSGNDESYQKEIQEEINGRRRYLQHNEQSPFNIAKIEYRDPIYYPIDPEYKVMATLERITERQTINLGTSDGQSERYLKFGYLQFNLQGQPLKLLVLKPAGMGPINNYFLGFADDTSGEETYGGGRYMDVTIGKSNKVVLDFNLAYNPYCAYAPDFVCPLPPAENILPTAINAGELDFK